MRRSNLAGVIVLITIAMFSVSGGIDVGSAAEKVKIRFNWKVGAPQVVYFLAKEKGWFQEKGLDVEMTLGTGSMDSVKLTAAGEFDLAEASAGALLKGLTKGLPLQAVAMIYQDSPTVFMVLETSDIKTLKDIEGKRVGIRPAGAVFPEYLALLKINNIDRSRIKEVVIGTGDAPLFVGQIDVLPNYVQEKPRYERKYGKKLRLLKFKDYGLNLYTTAIIAKTSTISRRPEMINKFINVVSRGWGYIAEGHQEEAVDALVKKYPELNRQGLLEELDIFLGLSITDETKKNGWGYMTLSRWAKTIDTLRAQGILKKDIDPAKCFTSSFISRN
ncbi:MAG: ABC transporter substrate-binding protein [Deltaproteobacteria bacterium]|nr:ABC transporter substrate-binding protein [Deltaproteobacteria bacterium]